MPVTVTAILTSDIRSPTSLALDRSDAMNVDPDYSAAYVILKTDLPDGLEGHGLTITSGRAHWSHVVGDSQLRWVGPEKGVIHLATVAIVKARRLAREGVGAGWTHFKIKVDRNVDEDIRRAQIMAADAYPNGSAWVALRRTEKVTA